MSADPAVAVETGNAADADVSGDTSAITAIDYGIGDIRKDHSGSWRHAIRGDWKELRAAPFAIRNDREAVLGAVGQNEAALEYATEELKSDKAFVLEAVKTYGEAIRHAAAVLRGDREVVLAAICQNRLALRHASEELRADVGLVVEAMRNRGAGHNLECAAEELGAPLEVVREASQELHPDGWKKKVLRDWQKLGVAPLATRSDKELVIEVVRDSWGMALCHASETLRGDRDVVLEAVRLRGETLRFASDDVKGNREVVGEAVRESWHAFQYASEALRGDPDIALEAMTQSMEVLEYATQALRGDNAFMLRVVRCNGLALRFASEELRADPGLALEAFKQNNMALQYVPEAARAQVWQGSHSLLDLGTTQATTRWLDVAQSPRRNQQQATRAA